MPRGDGTGPARLGPMTGRAAGYCTGYSMPGFLSAVPGRGWGRGFGWGGGRGRGWLHGFYATGLPRWAGWGPWPVYPVAPPTGEQEIEFLREQAKHMESALAKLRQRISELESNQAKVD
jgi:hypothetical protein